MGSPHRDTLRPDQAVTPNSAAFQAWQKSRRITPELFAPHVSSVHPASGQWGSGSGSGGYGLALISADDASQERIRAIMRDICEREKRK